MSWFVFLYVLTQYNRFLKCDSLNLLFFKVIKKKKKNNAEC